MAKVSDVYQGTYLSVEKFPTVPEAHTITEIGFDADNNSKAKDAKVIYIKIDKTDVKVRVNRTNAAELAKEWGDDLDGWLGRTVMIHRTQMNIRGQQGWGGIIRAGENKTKGPKGKKS